MHLLSVSLAVSLWYHTTYQTHKKQNKTSSHTNEIKLITVCKHLSKVCECVSVSVCSTWVKSDVSDLNQTSTDLSAVPGFISFHASALNQVGVLVWHSVMSRTLSWISETWRKWFSSELSCQDSACSKGWFLSNLWQPPSQRSMTFEHRHIACVSHQGNQIKHISVGVYSLVSGGWPTLSENRAKWKRLTLAIPRLQWVNSQKPKKNKTPMVWIMKKMKHRLVCVSSMNNSNNYWFDASPGDLPCQTPRQHMWFHCLAQGHYISKQGRELAPLQLLVYLYILVDGGLHPPVAKTSLYRQS